MNQEASPSSANLITDVFSPNCQVINWPEPLQIQHIIRWLIYCKCAVFQGFRIICVKIGSAKGRLLLLLGYLF